MYQILKNKTMLILSYWGYPVGGGEEYLYQTAIWAVKHKMRAYWICFANSKNEFYVDFSVSEIDGFKLIKIPGGFNQKILLDWVKLINPDIIHHQGHLRKDFHDALTQLRIPFLTGIHFWTGVVQLGSETLNMDILKNLDKHNIDSDYLQLYESPYCFFYSVSKFVSECVNSLADKKIKYLAYSSSIKDKYYIEKNNPVTSEYVTVINIHLLKGGELILYLLEQLTDIPFIVIRTENQSEKLDKKIYDAIEKRNSDPSLSKYIKCVYMERIYDVKPIFAKTKIFLAPSIVDETFCRTVNEAMMNSIPVITSGQGNLKYLVENAGIVIDHNKKEQWRDCIKELYNNENLIKNIVEKTKIKYEEYSDEMAEKMFFDMLCDVTKKSKSANIMILAPWCDQGLGIQSRNYYNILKSNGYNVCIFSYNPYGAKTTIELQKEPKEWLIENIYYSTHDREHITDVEILSFIKKYNIGKCIIPETCWHRIFEMAKLMRENSIKVYAIPNVEIVRRDEISKHKYFFKILCNNKICENTMINYGISFCEYVGYGIFDDNIVFKNKQKSDKLKFLFVGGNNAFSRKNILLICEGFVLAYLSNPNLHLTCTVQKINALENDDVNKITQYMDHPGITFIQSHLSYDKIIELYYEHHISIQVSKHEGLGLGFYEAIATGTPVLSLNTPPHNEIIHDGINGWLIENYYKDMADNTNSFLKSACFDPKLLGEKILEIAVCDLDLIIEKLIDDYNSRLAPNVFVKKFIEALND